LGLAGTPTKASQTMITEIITALLATALDSAWSMCRAGQKAMLAETDAAVRFWERIGRAGVALEAIVDRLAARCGIDISAYMIGRAYGL